jgi:hypothetical protein
MLLRLTESATTRIGLTVEAATRVRLAVEGSYPVRAFPTMRYTLCQHGNATTVARIVPEKRATVAMVAESVSLQELTPKVECPC